MNTLVLDCEQLQAPCGVMLIVTDGEGNLRALDWQGCETRMNRLFRLHYGAGLVRLQIRTKPSRARLALESYLAGDLAAIHGLPVQTGGTPFQRIVWNALRNIPPGATLSYGMLAMKINRKGAVRAVGLANGANPVAVVVPCHRVIGADRSLTGYAGGIERKRWLLQHEGVHTA